MKTSFAHLLFRKVITAGTFVALCSLVLGAGPAQARSPQGAVKRVDSNGDGKVSSDEWDKSMAVFERIDADDDGFLTVEEFDAHFNGTAKNLSSDRTTPEWQHFKNAVSEWNGDEEVGQWLKANFQFSKERQSYASKQRKKSPFLAPVRGASGTFDKPSGYCIDAAQFALEAINEINPTYEPRLVFITNTTGHDNHWVTGYKKNGKIYIMDYGAGPAWKSMKGIHGPYDNLNGYRDFLASLRIKNFKVGEVSWRNFQGKLD